MDTTTAPLIMFDGPDGVGKTSQLQLFKETAEATGLDVYTTRMLGGTPFGEALRQAIFISEFRTPTSDLYTALAMAHTLAADLEVKRAEYDLILVDRSPLSILAFQVAGSGLEQAKGLEGCELELSWLKPSAICLYHATQETLLARLPTRSQVGKGDYFEDQDHSYHERVAEAYKLAASRYADLIIDISADGTLEEVAMRTREALQEKLHLELNS